MNRIKNTGITHPKSKSNFQDSLAFKHEVDQYLDRKIIEWRESVPHANHLEGSEINKRWYERHTIEHVWRIRLMRNAQVRVLHAIGKISPEAAQLYARYQDEEMLHDKLFMQDLNVLGISEDFIYQTEPFLATRLLAGLLYFIAEHENPIGAICYSYLVEYTTQKITPSQLLAMRESVGEDKIRGQASHLNTDIIEDHTGDMWRLLNHLIFTEEDERMVFTYIDEIQGLLAMYFRELHAATVGKVPQQAG